MKNYRETMLQKETEYRISVANYDAAPASTCDGEPYEQCIAARDAYYAAQNAFWESGETC